MTRLILSLTFMAMCSPAYAQLGGLLDKAKKAQAQQAEIRRAQHYRRGGAQDRRGRQREDPRALRRRAGRTGPQVRHARRAVGGARIRAPEARVDLHRARHRRRQRVRSARRPRAHHARCARAPQERGGAGRRARARGRPRRPQAHGERDQEKQSGPDGHQHGDEGSRLVSESAHEQGVRDGPRELVRSRRRGRRRQGGGCIHAESRLRVGDARRLPDAARRPQQGSAGAQRPVRLASGDERTDRQDSPGRQARSGGRTARRATSRTSSTPRCRSPPSPPSKRDRPD